MGVGDEACTSRSQKGWESTGQGKGTGLPPPQPPPILPTTRPASGTLCSPAQAATSRRATEGRNQRKRERKRKRVRVGGQEGLRAGGTVDTLQALLSKSGQPKEDGEGRKTDWRRKGRKRRKEEGRERKTREKEAQTGIQADSGTWNTSCYSLECALSGRLIAGAGLSVCLSAASCEAYRLGWGMWLQARSSQPEIWLSASRMCLLERLWEGPGAH